MLQPVLKTSQKPAGFPLKIEGFVKSKNDIVFGNDCVKKAPEIP
jgi:hypothetical protein